MTDAPNFFTGTDDLALLEALKLFNDFSAIAQNVQFSVRFTGVELEARWKALLTDENVAREATKAMSTAPAYKIPWTHYENELLNELLRADPSGGMNIKSIFERNRTKFHPSRNSRMISEIHDRGDQVHFGTPEFSVVQRQAAIAALSAPSTAALEPETEEEKAEALQDVMLACALEMDMDRDLPEKEKPLAMLRGRRSRYVVNCKEIVIGRATNDVAVDFDLRTEGDASDMEPRQAVIKLKLNGQFYIKNLGTQRFFVDGRRLNQGRRVMMKHSSLIEIGNFSLVFESNTGLLSKIGKALERA